MSKDTEKESMFQSFQKRVSSRVTQAADYVTQKIPFLSKNSKDTTDKNKSTDSFADPPKTPKTEPKNYTVLSTSITDVVSQLQALPTDSKGLRDSLTKAIAILQDLKRTLLEGDPSTRDQSHASAITDVIQKLEKLSKESATTVNTSNVTTVIAIATTTLNTVASTMTHVSASGIFNKIIEIIQQLFYPLLILYLASLVSNEMIVYPAPIRFLFFFFVLTLCSVFSPATVILVFYYLVKAGYSYYRNHLEDRDGDTTEIRIYPRIFAVLPITTTPGASLLGRFFKYPFHYPKTELERKELERTDGKGGSIMDEYMEVLKESFPYGETVKGSEPFAERYEKIEKNIKRIHQSPVPILTNNPSIPPLPAVIVPKASRNAAPTSLPAVIVPKASSNAAPTSLPAVIVPKVSSNAAPTSLPAVIVPKALPGIITPTSTQANILEAMASNRPTMPTPTISGANIPSTNMPSTNIPSTNISATKMPSTNISATKMPAAKMPAAKMPATIANPQKGGSLKTSSPTSGGWFWNGI